MFAKCFKSLAATTTLAAGGAVADDGRPKAMPPSNEPMAGLRLPEAQKVEWRTCPR